MRDAAGEAAVTERPRGGVAAAWRGGAAHALVVAALAGVLLGSGGCRRAGSAAAPPPGETVAVRVAVVEERTAGREVFVPGTARPVDRSAIAARVPGEVKAVRATLGQGVAAGEVLLELAAPELLARLAAAEAELARVAHDLERESGLLAQKVGTPDTVRRLELEKVAAAARVDEARTLAGYLRVTAPFAGRVVARPAQVGDTVMPGQTLLALERAGPLRVEADLPESLAAGLAPGALLRVEADGAAWTGTIAELSAAADAATRTRRAKLDLPAEAAVGSGAFVRVALPAGEVRSLAVPTAAVSTFGQMERVFAVHDGRAVLRLVRTGARRDGAVEILSGLVVGERVVVAHEAPLRDAQPVEVRP